MKLGEHYLFYVQQHCVLCRIRFCTPHPFAGREDASQTELVHSWMSVLHTLTRKQDVCVARVCVDPSLASLGSLVCTLESRTLLTRSPLACTCLSHTVHVRSWALCSGNVSSSTFSCDRLSYESWCMVFKIERTTLYNMLETEWDEMRFSIICFGWYMCRQVLAWRKEGLLCTVLQRQLHAKAPCAAWHTGCPTYAIHSLLIIMQVVSNTRSPAALSTAG